MDTLPPFQVFLDEHRDVVYRYTLARVGADDADDCFQETFVAALRGYPRLEGNSNLRAWVLRIAERKVIDFYRARERTPVPQEHLPEGQDPRSEPRREPGLWRAVRSLPPKQQAAIVHRFIGDLPYAEIGEIIGSSEEAARQNVREGLKRLRKVWTR
jgi:RNA polymerase sigma factor (sigma-70 family)